MGAEKAGTMSGFPTLPDGWSYSSIGELVEPRGVSYGIVQPGKHDDGGVPIVRVKDIVNGCVNTWNVLRVNRQVEEKYQRTRLKGGEILLSLVGSVGEVAVASDELRGWNVARAIAVIRPLCPDNTEWMKYCLKGGVARRCMAVWQTNTVQATLNLRDVLRIPVAMPPKLVRTAVVEILGALENKIAVNDRIVEKSRMLGESRFRSEVAVSGWHRSTIAGLASLLIRGGAPNYVDPPDGMTVINQKCVRHGRVDLAPARRTLPERVREERVLRLGDVLVNSTGVGTLGRVARWDRNRDATVDSHVTIVRFDPAKVVPIVGAFAMLGAQSQLEALGEGSTGQTELNRAKLGQLVLDLPEPKCWPELGDALGKLEATGRARLDENRTLTELRDTLLPKLVSGQIRIKDAERAVEEVV